MNQFDILTSEWWEPVLAAWNAESGNHRFLAGAGIVRFGIIDNDDLFYVFWDDIGTAAISHRVNPNEVYKLTFRASADNWSSFIRGEFRSALGVLSGKICFEGSYGFAIRFSSGFDRLAEITRSVHSTD